MPVYEKLKHINF